MATIKGVHYTDVHLQDNNPASRRGSYLEDILAKLHHIGNFAKKKKCDFTSCGGDLFNIKTPNRNSFSMVNRVIDMYSSWNMLNLLVEGNHDIRNDQVETIDDQPIGSLFRSGAIKHLRNELIKKKGIEVRIQGYDFEEEPDFSKLVLKEEDRADVNILVLHVYAGPKEADLFGTKIHGYAEISQTGHDVYMFGHYHKNQGIVELPRDSGNPQYFVNLGSVSRGDYGDMNLKRTPQFCYLELTKKTKDSPVEIILEAVDIPCRKGEEVFDVEQKTREKEHLEEANKFVESLKLASITEDLDESDTLAAEDGSSGNKELSAALKGLEVESGVMKEVQRFIKEASESLGGSGA